MKSGFFCLQVNIVTVNYRQWIVYKYYNSKVERLQTSKLTDTQT